jgi:DNA (cytosine-5)-methyltransferase 1
MRMLYFGMRNKLKVASFFSGIGGFDLAFENAGMKVIFQSEINQFCQKVLRKHWPNVPLNSDILQLDPGTVPDAEIFCGGFPCQDLSLANQGKRRGLAGERSGLFFKYAEIIKVKKPQWVVIENVPGLLNSNSGQDFRVLLEHMDELGYCVSWRVFDAKYFGTPQRRRRVFVVCSLGTRGSFDVLFGGQSIEAVHRQGLGSRDSTSNKLDRSDQSADYFSIQHACIGRKPSAGPQAKGYRNDGETYTLDSRGSSDVVCSTNATFRVREITGIPGQLDGNRLRALGNAVNVAVAEWIGHRIVKCHKEYYSK